MKLFFRVKFVDNSIIRMQKSKWIFFILSLVMVLCYTSSCKKDELNGIANNSELLPTLSGYDIFQGDAADLHPATDFKLYELPTTLFTDYAEKQRLIKVPAGTKILASTDGLPDFPEGTILVKTFYYFHDKRDVSKGKTIIETRLLIKSASGWNVGTYLWNKEQSAAYLITSGLNRTINWISENGKANVISYHVPSNRECTTCHNSSGAIIPIGPKIRNLNRDVNRNGGTINQLIYFQNENLLHTIDPSSFTCLPDAKNNAETLEHRARAYVDMNCAHCHNPTGFASGSGVFFGYDLSMEETKIAEKKSGMINVLTKGDMPKLGTTLIDEEGLALVKEYVEQLK